MVHFTLCHPRSTLRAERGDSAPVVHGDCSELVGIETGAAHQRAVYVLLGHELSDVRRLHRAPVLDAHGGSGLFAPSVTDRAADEPTDGLSVTGCGVPACSDGPDGLIGDHHVGDLLSRDALEAGSDLPDHLVIGAARFPLLDGLTD